MLVHVFWQRVTTTHKCFIDLLLRHCQGAIIPGNKILQTAIIRIYTHTADQNRLIFAWHTALAWRRRRRNAGRQHCVQFAGRFEVLRQQQHRTTAHRVHGVLPRQPAVERFGQFAGDERIRARLHRHQALEHCDVAVHEHTILS